jgi:hypothetical protein
MPSEDDLRMVITYSVERAERAAKLIDPILIRCQKDIDKMSEILRKHMLMTVAQARRAVMDLLRP